MGKIYKYLIKKCEFNEKELNSYDIILEEYKDEINTEEEFNKTLSLLNHRRNIFETNNKLINFSIPIISIFISIAINYFTGEYLMYLIFAMTLLYTIKVLSDFIKIGPSANKLNTDFRIQILEQNKEIFIKKDKPSNNEKNNNT